MPIAPIKRRGLRPQSFRGVIASQRVYDYYAGKFSKFSHYYTPTEWKRRKAAKKVAKRSRIINRRNK